MSNNVVHFRAATAYARKIEMMRQIVHGTSTHRSMVAKLENGRLIIEQEWFTIKKQKKN